MNEHTLFCLSIVSIPLSFFLIPAAPIAGFIASKVTTRCLDADLPNSTWRRGNRDGAAFTRSRNSIFCFVVRVSCSSWLSIKVSVKINAHDVFISYSTKDKSIADAVCPTLESPRSAAGSRPAMSRPAKGTGKAIINAISQSRVVISGSFSSWANTSEAVKREAERAFSKGIVIVPFRIEDIEPAGGLEFYLSTTHWLDAMTKPLEAHLHRLCSTVGVILEPDGAPAPVPPRSFEWGRLRRGWVAGALVILAMLTLLLAVGLRRPHRTARAEHGAGLPLGERHAPEDPHGPHATGAFRRLFSRRQDAGQRGRGRERRRCHRTLGPDDRRVLRTLAAGTRFIHVAFSSNGRILASGGQGGPGDPLALWDVPSGRKLRTLDGQRDTVYTVAFSPDGNLLAGDGEDGAVTLWDVPSGRQQDRLTGHQDDVYSVAFSPDRPGARQRGRGAKWRRQFRRDLGSCR